MSSSIGGMAPSPTREVCALEAPGIALMSMRDVAFLGLVPMRMPLVEGEPGMVALLRSMREVADLTAPSDIQVPA
jgi:hypothetical protein